VTPAADRPGIAVRVLTVLWPAFAAAALIDGLVFAAIDPLELRWFGDGAPLSRQAIHTLAFLLFWALTSAAAATTLLLCEARGRRLAEGP
jgi:hypothetical protein